ncbi:hypothetical protein EV176_004283 [Coemansia sp. RSA 451]|nr:hypothetical protein IW142_001220 [Coemansia sp. RSA 564]KAJ2270516.1 hypothetical protein EV176_004283 [Coemansia sp. RSA 451]KAJ2409720.1 hypothetical protein J3F80_001072 [Coemansia sp. RSA 2526]
MVIVRPHSATSDTFVGAGAKKPESRRPVFDQAQRLGRRSFSESHTQSDTIGFTHSSRESKRLSHQRTISASSPASSADTTSWPEKRSVRIAGVLRTSLRRSPDAELRPAMRARAVTDISTDYVAVSIGAGDGQTITRRDSRPASREAVEDTFRARKRSLSVGGENSCCDFFARQIEKYGLEPLLTSPVATCYFLASLISSFAPESLLFYLEAEHYRTGSFSDDARRTRYAKGLYKAFISQRAPMEINISHIMRLRVTDVFRNAEPVTLSLFQETQAHVRVLLEQEFSQFRQRPSFNHMLSELSSARKDTHSQHAHAVAAVYDALSATYGVHSLPASKTHLVQTEAPLFTKFVDMDLTSSELLVALPAWLCRTTVRLLDTPMPSSRDDMRLALRSPLSAPPIDLLPTTAVASAPPTARAIVPSATNSTTKKASKQKSMQRLRFRFQLDSNSTNSHHRGSSGPSSAPATVKSRWESLWSSRRRKA